MAVKQTSANSKPVGPTMSDELLKSLDERIRRVKQLREDAFGKVQTVRILPCQENPPRFSNDDCRECPDQCEPIPKKGTA